MDYNKLAYICSPYRGSIFQKYRNIRYAERLTKMAVRLGYAPITTHLYITKALDDDKPRERRQGLKAGKEILASCGTIIIGARYGISEGMAAEIEAARKHRTIIIF